jgi:DNA polymerase-1
VYEAIEMPVAEVLGRIERHGVLIDSAVLARQSHELGERLLALEQQAHELAGQPFNLGSPKQIGEILFGKLGLPAKKKTASGAPSTSEDVLQELAADYPLPAKILEHRSLAKLKGTYTDKLPLMVNPDTGRVHTNYAQAVAVVLQHKRASISLVQRHLRIGYNRAARLLEQMEKSGVVSAMGHAGYREILVPRREEGS